MSANKPSSLIWRILTSFASFKLASTLFLLLLVLTWLGTLEQTEVGLYTAVAKYFSYESFFVIPKLNGHTLPLILPGGYWVCALLFLNILAGGVIRIRKNWRNFGVILSHFGILLLLLGGMVTHHRSTRGMLTIWENETANTARETLKHVIEITELSGTEEGSALKASTVHYIDWKHLEDLAPADHRLYKLKNLPFDLKVAGFQINSRAEAASTQPPRNSELVLDGYYLKGLDPDKMSEINAPGCYIRLVDKAGVEKEAYLLWATSSVYMNPEKLTVQWEGKSYLIDLCKKAWVLPFDVELADFRAKYYPGTRTPESFESDVVRRDDTGAKPTLIKMNQPLRYDGYTLFQTNYGPQQGNPTRMFSVFEVVKNPSDQWPLYALYVSSAGLLIHFIYKLGSYLLRQGGRSRRGRKKDGSSSENSTSNANS